MAKTPAILVANAGSSSLKFALFRTDEKRDTPARIDGGMFESAGPAAAMSQLARLHDRVAQHDDIEVIAVGHRVVHGGAEFSEPQILHDGIISKLSDLADLSPEHMPAALALIGALRGLYSTVPHIACFDTAFHFALPVQARMLPIPRRYFQKGVRRYGFHGISYAYLMEELFRIASDEAKGRVLLMHLGHGASMAAVRNGQAIDTTMALTPASGLVMSTRSGDLDPGIGAYLAKKDGLTPAQFQTMIHQESGLLGISEQSGDVRELLAREASNPHAAEALSIFCYQARKWIGALAAALCGIDTLVFCGGIGENSQAIRARICAGLEFLGVALDESANEKHAAVISNERSRVVVRVLHTDEETYIARAVMRKLSGRAA